MKAIGEGDQKETEIAAHSQLQGLMASLGHLVRLSSLFLVALICRSVGGAAGENASIRTIHHDANPLSRMNTKLPKKQQQQQQPRSSSSPGSSPVGGAVVGSRNSTRLTVRAIPKNSVLSRPSVENSFFDGDSSVTIRCRVKCIVSKLEDLPTVSFHFQIAEGTVLPLSSGMPGVDIFISATHSRRQRPYKDTDDARAITTYRSDTHLTIDSSAILLRPGRNSFVCSAYSPSTGRRRADRFVVHLPPPL